MNDFRNFVRFAAPVLLLLGCSGSTNVVDYADATTQKSAKNVVLFMDGTGNNHNSRTNITKLYELATNQNRNDLSVFYTSGVGADGTSVVGLATGLGTGHDVQSAYRFLANTYSKKDYVHLYGFSRGAYSARILAGFVHAAGLVELNGLSVPEQEEVVERLYRAYKGKKSIGKRRERVNAVLQQRSLTQKVDHFDFRFNMVGLWETVEALGLPNRKDTPDFVNERYSDQICNMDRVFHAMALDDNRARTYTPILMTRKQMTDDCVEGKKPDVNDVVTEVWFSGAHADVGGGYSTGFLPGVSLNWMLRNAEKKGINNTSIFPAGAAVYANPKDIAHDAENQNLVFHIFKEQFRGLFNYLEGSNASTVSAIKVHDSVFARLEAWIERVPASERRELDGSDPLALSSENLPTAFDKCFKAYGYTDKSGKTVVTSYKFIGCKWIVKEG